MNYKLNSRERTPAVALTLWRGRQRSRQSARGLAHSKTWRKFFRFVTRGSVLECASPLALYVASKCDQRPDHRQNRSRKDTCGHIRTRIDTLDSFVGSNVTRMPKTEHRTSNPDGIGKRRTRNVGQSRRNPLIFRMWTAFCGSISHCKFLIFRKLSHPMPVKTAYFIGYFTPKCLVFRR